MRRVTNTFDSLAGGPGGPLRCRHLIPVTFVIALAFALVPAHAGAIEPIVGYWNDGGVVQVTQTGPGQFALHTLKPAPRPCGAKDLDGRLTGGGLAYSGTIAFYWIDGCGPAGRGGFRVDLAGDLRSGSWSDTPPTECCASSGTWTRIGDPPPAAFCLPARGSVPAGCDSNAFANPERPLIDQIGGAAYAVVDFLFLEDLRTLLDPQVSDLEKAVLIASYFVPVPGGFMLKKAAGALLKKLGPVATKLLRQAQKLLAKTCVLARKQMKAAASCGPKIVKNVQQALKRKLKGPDAQQAIIKTVLYPGGKLIGTPGKGKNVRELPGGDKEAQAILNKLKYFGKKLSSKVKDGSAYQIPGPKGYKNTLNHRNTTKSLPHPGVEIKFGKFQLKLHFTGP